MILDIPEFLIKDKQAFNSSMRMIGKPIDICKHLQKSGTKLVHIVDLDALKGMETNMDIYNHVTHFVNIEVEVAPKESLIIKLLTIKARVVLKLPCALDSSKFQEKKLLVGKIDSGFSGDVSLMHDLVITNAKKEDLERFSKTHRIIVYAKDNEKLGSTSVFGVINPRII